MEQASTPGWSSLSKPVPLPKTNVSLTETAEANLRPALLSNVSNEDVEWEETSRTEDTIDSFLFEAEEGPKLCFVCLIDTSYKQETALLLLMVWPLLLLVTFTKLVLGFLGCFRYLSAAAAASAAAVLPAHRNLWLEPIFWVSVASFLSTLYAVSVGFAALLNHHKIGHTLKEFRLHRAFDRSLLLHALGAAVSLFSFSKLLMGSLLTLDSKGTVNPLPWPSRQQQIPATPLGAAAGPAAAAAAAAQTAAAIATAAQHYTNARAAASAPAAAAPHHAAPTAATGPEAAAHTPEAAAPQDHAAVPTAAAVPGEASVASLTFPGVSTPDEAKAGAANVQELVADKTAAEGPARGAAATTKDTVASDAPPTAPVPAVPHAAVLTKAAGDAATIPQQFLGVHSESGETQPAAANVQQQQQQQRRQRRDKERLMLEPEEWHPQQQQQQQHAENYATTAMLELSVSAIGSSPAAAATAAAVAGQEYRSPLYKPLLLSCICLDIPALLLHSAAFFLLWKVAKKVGRLFGMRMPKIPF